MHGEKGGDMAVRYQLRDYRIEVGRLDDFVRAWQSEILPLREEMGFKVHLALASAGEHRFMWLLSHDEPFEEADAAYYADPRRGTLDPNPAQWIVEGEKRFVDPVVLRGG